MAPLTTRSDATLDLAFFLSDRAAMQFAPIPPRTIRIKPQSRFSFELDLARSSGTGADWHSSATDPLSATGLPLLVLRLYAMESVTLRVGPLATPDRMVYLCMGLQGEAGRAAGCGSGRAARLSVHSIVTYGRG